jgi:hypothetical protein
MTSNHLALFTVISVNVHVKNKAAVSEDLVHESIDAPNWHALSAQNEATAD